MIDKLIVNIENSSPLKVSVLATFFTLSGSVPTVYLFSLLFSQEYTSFLLTISIALPIILTPLVIMLVLKLSKHLKHFKDALEIEVEKNKKADILLFEQARFVVMGEMMANISHQWKQPLNTIALSVVSLRTSSEYSSKSDKYFDIMEDNVNYLAATIDDFMSFFDAKTSSEMRRISSLVREIQSIVDSHMLNKEIDLEILIDDSYGDVEIASSISQVLLNLINNSKYQTNFKIKLF